MELCKICKVRDFCKNETLQEDVDEIKEGLYEIVKSKAKIRLRKDRQLEPQTTKSIFCYRAALLKSVIDQQGKDYYTGREIDWNLAKNGGKTPSAPTIDHKKPSCKNAIDINGNPNIVFCRYDFNDAKNDLSEFGFTKLCIRFLRKKGFEVKKK